jgi:hypothetical protein
VPPFRLHAVAVTLGFMMVSHLFDTDWELTSVSVLISELQKQTGGKREHHI